MNFLITGGAGSVGRDLTSSLLEKGHRIRVLDRHAEAFAPLADKKLEWIQGRLEDSPLVTEALRGVDTVIHLAWSFSDDPVELLESDLKGHVVLLDACVAAKVARLFYASTAVVYGKPVQAPITEESPCLVEEARKPFYAVAKQTAEKLALIYWKTKGLPVTVFRFWWSYGKNIGGRHLRDMITLARKGQPLMVPDGAGGSFLDHDDLTHALLLAMNRQESVGQIFNLATIYLEWKDIARMILEVTGSSSSPEVITAREWKGAKFLADPWELSIAKAERLFDYRSLFSPTIARQRLKKAVELCREEIESKS
ncbi:MAG: NAD(P)-dependent oxidoreductase [Syntrophus sp. (in: bacteria)]|nr:NAD(P)-dependent oxidoreductase [Syntrophus sp. (in: bacteria)]